MASLHPPDMACGRYHPPGHGGNAAFRLHVGGAGICPIRPVPVELGCRYYEKQGGRRGKPEKGAVRAARCW
ncbi:hypothetical protein BZG21_30480, partial [Escherichia coli]|nr:hypothetical protein [Escherichia coli]